MNILIQEYFAKGNRVFCVYIVCLFVCFNIAQLVFKSSRIRGLISEGIEVVS